MSVRNAALVAAALGMFVPAPAQSQIGAVRSFKNWAVGCDNVRACRAMGFPAEDALEQPILMLDRAGAASAAPQLGLIWGGEEQKRGRFTLAADGERLGMVDGVGKLPPSTGAAVLAKLRTAKELTLTPAEGGETFRISLDGASAALLFMDDWQKRVGTSTALVRPGSRAASEVPPPPAPPAAPTPPAVAKKPFSEVAPQPVVRLFRSEAAKACDLDEVEAKAAKAVIAHRLTSAEVLYGIECWRAAYNSGVAFYILAESPGGGTARRAGFPDPIDRTGTDGASIWPKHVVSNADFDADGVEVTSFHKGRGIGDCGDTLQWRWDGAAFQPISVSSMPTCRGLNEEHWLRVYRVGEPPGSGKKQ